MKHLAFLLLIIPSLACSQTSAKYDYASITQENHIIGITINDETFEEINVKNENYEKRYDYRPLFKRVKGLEDKGWEVLTVNSSDYGAAISRMVFVLRKERRD